MKKVDKGGVALFILVCFLCLCVSLRGLVFDDRFQVIAGLLALIVAGYQTYQFSKIKR